MRGENFCLIGANAHVIKSDAHAISFDAHVISFDEVAVRFVRVSVRSECDVILRYWQGKFVVFASFLQQSVHYGHLPPLLPYLPPWRKSR